MKAIYKRELNSYFHTMIGYVFIAFLVAYTGIYFMAYNLNYGYPYFSYVLSGVLFVLLIAVPVLTMRSFAEERKNKNGPATSDITGERGKDRSGKISCHGNDPGSALCDLSDLSSDH